MRREKQLSLLPLERKMKLSMTSSAAQKPAWYLSEHDMNAVQGDGVYSGHVPVMFWREEESGLLIWAK